MEAEAQGRTPRTPKSQKRRGGPSPGASAGSSALGPPELRCLVPRTRGVWCPGLGVQGGWMSVVRSPRFHLLLQTLEAHAGCNSPRSSWMMGMTLHSQVGEPRMK